MTALPFVRNSFARPEKQPNIYAEVNSIDRAPASLGQVAGAFVDEMLRGEGSLRQDINATDIQIGSGQSGGFVGLFYDSEQKQALREGVPLSEEEWKESQWYREGVEYQPGMNSEAARVLSEVEDERNRRAFVINKATTSQKVAGFAAGFASAFAEPKNLLATIGAAVTTSGLAAFVPSIRRLFQISESIGRYKALAARGALEGALGAAIVEPSNIASSKIVQGDYDLSDSIVNFTVNSLLGAGLNVGPVYIRDWIKQRNGMQRVADEFDLATQQIAEGRGIDVEVVDLLHKTQEVVPLSTLKRKDLNKLALSSTQKIKKNLYESRIDSEEGLLAGAVGRGSTAEEAAADLISQYKLEKATTKTPDDAGLVTQIDALKDRLSRIDEEFDQRLRELDFPVDVFAGLKGRVQELASERELKRSTITGEKLEKKLRLFDEETEELISGYKQDLDNFIALNEQGKIQQVAQDIQQEKQRLRGQISTMEKAVKKQRQEKFEPVIKSKIDQADQSPSTAYSKEDSNIAEDLIETNLDEDINFLLEDIEATRNQLDQSDLDLLAAMRDADALAEGYDAAYFHASICLTRG